MGSSSPWALKGYPMRDEIYREAVGEVEVQGR